MDVAAALLTECGVPAADAGGDRSGVEVLNVALSIKIKIKKIYYVRRTKAGTH